MNWAFIATIAVGLWSLGLVFLLALLKAGADEDAARLELHGDDCPCVSHR